MAQTSFALMTTLGRSKEAAALANATTIEITHIAIGDGSTVPSGGETALYNEVARKTISGHGVVVGATNTAYFDIFLAADDGPYTIREAGLFDSDGDLIAIAHYDPPISKPVPASGQTVEGTVRLEVAFSDIASIVIKIDPAMKVALQRLTRLPWVPVISMSLAAPPASPAVGDAYVVAADPTGAWVGQAGKIAEYTVAGWAIIDPPDGHGVSLPDGRVFERVSGAYVEKIALDSQAGKWAYAAAGGTANALTATLSPAPLSLVAGMRVRLKTSAANTGGMTLNVNGLGAKSIVRKDLSALAGGSIVANQILDVVYDGSTWQALDVVGGSGAYAVGKIVVVTASGTYTPSVGVRALMVEGIGGGGAGGGAPAISTSGDLSCGGGGGSGSYFRKLVVAPAASYAITIGAGGAAVAGANGNDGGTTSFASVCSATGGKGAEGGLIGPGWTSSSGGLGGTAVGGDINSDGTRGIRGARAPGSNTGGYGGEGAPSYLGGGGAASGGSSVPGANAVGYGAGGGGAVINSVGAAAQKGGAGASGIVIVTEYF